MDHRRFAVLGLLLTAVGLSLTACGGGGGGSSNNTSGGGTGGGTPLGTLIDPSVRDAIVTQVNTVITSLPTTDGLMNQTQLLTALKGVSGLSHVTATPDGSVAAMFSDGVPFTVINNAPIIAGPTPHVTRTISASPKTIPAGPTALLLDTMDPVLFSSRIHDDVALLNANGYSAQLQKASVTEFKQIGSIQPSLLYISGHGGPVVTKADPTASNTYGIWTSDKFVRTSTTFYDPDLKSGALGIGMAVVSTNSTGKSVYETHYMLLPYFEQLYNWKVKTGSPVFLGQCNAGSTIAASFRGWLLKNGASVMTAYSDEAYANSTYKAYSYILDRMCSANFIIPSQPPHRPFSLEDIKIVTDVAGGDDAHGHTKYTLNPAEGSRPTEMKLFYANIHPTATILKPSIKSVSINEKNKTVTLFGAFGDNPGHVFVGGSALTNVTWDPTFITATLPSLGAGSGGDVYVSVPFTGGDLKSNTREISEWAGAFTEIVTENGAQIGKAVLNPIMRFDIGQYYTTPDATTPTASAVTSPYRGLDPISLIRVEAGFDSTATAMIGGTDTDSSGTIYTYTQNGGTSLTYTGAVGSARQFYFDIGAPPTPGGTGRVTYGINITNGEHYNIKYTDGRNITNDTNLIFQTLRDTNGTNAGDYIVQFDAQYNILAGQGSFGAFTQHKTTWPQITCLHPPKQDSQTPI